MTIRPAHPDDAARIAGIYNHHVDAGGATFDVLHWDPLNVAESLPPKPPSGWYVAETDALGVVGWATLRPISDRAGFCHTLESGIYLHPDAVGSGLADPLQESLHLHAEQHAIHHIMARIISYNERSIAFHLRHGFEVVGVQREIGRLNSTWVDLTVMQKLI